MHARPPLSLHSALISLVLSLPLSSSAGQLAALAPWLSSDDSSSSSLLLLLGCLLCLYLPLLPLPPTPVTHQTMRWLSGGEEENLSQPAVLPAAWRRSRGERGAERRWGATCLSLYLSVCLSDSHPLVTVSVLSVRPSICPPLHSLMLFLFEQAICLSVLPSISVYTAVFLPFVCHSVLLSVWMSVCLCCLSFCSDSLSLCCN